MEPELLNGLARPADDREAEDWLAVVISALGPRFDPDEGFADYWLDDGDVERLDADLVWVRELLGVRIRDLTYREADGWLCRLDLNYREWARPVTQPPPRLWLVERPGLVSRTDALDAPVSLAFEDADGRWRVWEPATGRFHGDTPWLYTQFYFGAGAHRGVFVKDDFKQLMRFTPLSAVEARSLIDTGQVSGAGPKFISMRQRAELAGPELADVLSHAVDPTGWTPSADPDVVIRRGRRSEPPGPLPPMTGKVQLFDVEVEAERLTRGELGVGLAETLAPFEPFNREPDLEDLPATGWRQVREWPGPSGLARLLLAAPHPDDRDGWALINISTRDELRYVSAHPGPVRPRASKAARRAGLVLDWPEDPIVAVTGEPVELTAQLTNVSEAEWRALDRGPTDGQVADDLRVVAWLYDRDGSRLAAETSFTYSGFREQNTIAPGESVAIPVILMTQNTERLEPGEYEIRGLLGSLDLHAKSGTLKLITRDSG